MELEAAVGQGLASLAAKAYSATLLPCAWRLQDMAELEAAVGQSLAPVEALGGPHRVLRAFRPLLFLDTGALGGSPLLGALPPGVALSHLFSRAPPGLQSPHQRSGFTPAQVPPAHRQRPGIRVKGISLAAQALRVHARASAARESAPAASRD